MRDASTIGLRKFTCGRVERHDGTTFSDEVEELAQRLER
jgi:hypothetical protein